MNTPPPCIKEGKKCDKRHSGCHAKCKEFTDWQEARAQKIAEKRKRDAIDRQLDETNYKRCYEISKNKRRKR